MKILYLTSNEILKNNGGAIENRKIYISLKNIASKKNNINLETISLDKDIKNKLNIKIKKNNFKQYFARFFSHSTYFYFEWLKIREKIIKFNPDILILGNSRLGFIATHIKKNLNDCYIIGQFHNIEYNYVDAKKMEYKNKLIRKTFTFLEKKSVKNDEEAMLNNMDLGLFLTKRDALQAQKLYNFNGDFNILPICTKKDEIELKNENEYDINLVFIGSLWYASNANGIMWFVENIWSFLINKYDNINLIVGGSRPSNDLKEYLNSQKNIELHPNFNSIEDIVPINSFFVAPIRKGAGMKVKVADALSMGLKVFSSEEALVGYEEAYNDDINDSIIIKCNNEEEFVKKIEKNISSDLKFNEINKKAKSLHKKYYSLMRAEEQLANLLDKIEESLNL